MGQTPKGEPRTVPDPAGERVDAMLRQERLKRQRAEAASFPAFSPFARVDAVRKAPRDDKAITIGDRMYRSVDTGSSIKLVPFDPFYTPAEREAQKEAVVRALFMAQSPFGTLAYGAAAATGASQRTKDAALLAGGLVDRMAMGRAARPRTARPTPLSPEGVIAFRRPSIRLGELNVNGQATGVTATIEPRMLGTGKRVSRRITPAGLGSSGPPDNHDRGHLHARQLGGPHDKQENFATLSRSINRGKMRVFENEVASRVREGEVIEYTAKPIYLSGILPPSAIWLTAFGPNTPPIARLLHNPAGRRQ